MNIKLTAKDVRFILFILLILLFTFTKSFAATRTATTSGNWSSTATWGGNPVPVAADLVVINTNITVTVDGTYTCATITMNAPSSGQSNTLNVNSGNLTCTGNLTMSSTNTGRLNTINITTGTFSVSGTITVATSTASRIVISGIGNFIFSNASTLSTNLTLTATSGTVTYNAAGNQTIRTTTYNNLVFGGSGTKTLAGNTTVNNNLTINNGVTLDQNTRRITLSGNLIKNGTHTISSGEFRIAGTQNQSISGFTTTGLLNMTKTAGTATFTENVSCGTFTLNGSGGTLDLGAGLTHTISGIITRTAGTLNCNSSTLNIQSTVSGTGGTINTNSSTINYSGTAQTIIPIIYNNLTLSTSGIKTFPTGTTTVNGDLTLQGTATVTLTGTLTYGTSAGLVYDKPTHTIGNEWPSPFTGSGGITIQSGNVTLGSASSISSELNVNSGSTLTTSNLLTLTSNSSSTARLGTAKGTITGDVIVQRFIPGGSNKRKWRFLSSPVNVSGSIELSQYIDDIFVTAPAGSAAGFDDNPFGNNSSIRTYNESISGASNNGWTDPTDITNTISTGLGAEVFVRGSRSLTDPFMNWTTPDDVTIDFIGALNTGTISPTITYTPSIGGASTSDGFNLVGNPYASSINFTHSGLTKTNIDDKFWCYNPNTGSYGIYDAGLGDSTNGITRFIASGQAFFIRANAASPAITFTEDIKCTAEGNNYFKGTNSNQNVHSILHIIASNDSNYRDEALIVQDENASCFSGDEHDAGKLFNDALNVYTLSDDNVNMTINALPCSSTVDTISLAVFSYNGSNIMTTEHQFNFIGIENFPSTKKIYLLDQFTNTLTNLLYTTKYSFNITNDKASWGKNRFKLLFANSVLGVQSNSLNSNVELYPNPSNDIINLHFNAIESNTIQYYIYDISGRVIEYGTQELINNNSIISLTNLDQGNYIIKTINGNEVSVHRFTKN